MAEDAPGLAAPQLALEVGGEPLGGLLARCHPGSRQCAHDPFDASIVYADASQSATSQAARDRTMPRPWSARRRKTPG
jgi:hypothetical protein